MDVREFATISKGSIADLPTGSMMDGVSSAGNLYPYY